MKFGMSTMTIAIVAIVAGIMILVFPDLMRWIVGVFLIVWGILTLIGKK